MNGAQTGSQDPVIAVDHLTKWYGDLPAVTDVSFQIHRGEIFGLLGPNGAGKTTTVEILEGLRPRSGGDVRVLGFDPQAQPRRLKDRIGICLQATNLPEKLKVREALALFASFYTRTYSLHALLDRLHLAEKQDTFFAHLSGGQKQRLALALALVNDPEVLFLDEPTTGLDPQARHEIHHLIRAFREEGRTVLLTTHYIEEAERLCDRVAIMDGGRIIALGAPGELQDSILGGPRVEIACGAPLPANGLPTLPAVERYGLSPDHRRLTIHSAAPTRVLVELVEWMEARGIPLVEAGIRRPSLEDVFIELTGRRLRE
ncbi:MAG: ABC transporter ATP-binding protein [Acidobacteriota bacterium]